MNALVKTEPGRAKLALKNVPEPHPEAGHVVIEVSACGICGTDIHHYDDEFPSKPPVVLGHELAGRVVELGSGVTNPKEGDRVTINPTGGKLCGRCRYCEMGHPFLCMDRGSHGSVLDGGFAKYCCARKEVVFKLPDNVDNLAGTLSEPLACAYHAVVELTQITDGDLVVVSGPGPIGLLCAMLAKTRGGRVVMLGTSADTQRMDLSSKLGTDLVLNVAKEAPEQVIEDMTDGYGADVVFECSGAEASAKQCLGLLKKLGQFTQVGLFGKSITLDVDQLVHKQARIQGSICHTWETWKQVMNFMAKDQIDLNALISESLPLSRWEEGFNKVRKKEGIKILLHSED